jgi:hypothetical protein
MSRSELWVTRGGSCVIEESHSVRLEESVVLVDKMAVITLLGLDASKLALPLTSPQGQEKNEYIYSCGHHSL